jgi:hypothetical protein
MLILCFSLLPLAVAHAESITDNTYLVLVWTSQSSLLNPRWGDQFEFDAGDVYRAYTLWEGEITGTWLETELIDGPLFSLNWFQAQAGKIEEVTTTTTTTAPDENGARLAASSVTPQRVKFDINIYGLVSTFTIISPDPTLTDPFNTKSIGFSTMIGWGAYLGADARFLGFAGLQVGGGGGGGVGDPAFCYIAPDEGEQESTVTNIEITCSNTTFNDDGFNEIIFVPPDGLIVKNIAVQDNTTVEFDLEIAIDAPLGEKSVIVSWDDPPQTLSSDSASEFFTVIEKSN